MFQASPSGMLFPFWSATRRWKRRAIFRCPYGTELFISVANISSTAGFEAIKEGYRDFSPICSAQPYRSLRTRNSLTFSEATSTASFTVRPFPEPLPVIGTRGASAVRRMVEELVAAKHT